MNCNYKLCDSNKSIFNSITEVGDDEIILYNYNDIDKDKENKIPTTISIGEIIEKYIRQNTHISILSLLKIIDRNILESDNHLVNNINFYLYKIYVPSYSTTKNIPLL